MQCGVEGRVVRIMRMAGVKYFECREEGHKCKECPVWKKRKNEEKVAHMVKPQKAQ